MPVEAMVTDLLSVSLCCVYFCNLLSGWGLRGLQLCFLCDRCSRFAPSKSIFITNQRAAFCLLLLRGSGDIWLLPSAPASNPCAPQRLQICIHECFCQRPMYLLLRPQIVWSTCLASWLLGFLWANFTLSFLHHLVPCVYSGPHIPLEPQGGPWEEMSAVAC